MKKVALSLIAAIVFSTSLISCTKGNDADLLVDPGPTIQHPDSTKIVVTVPSGTTDVRMVGDMKGDWPTGWQPANLGTSSLQLDKVDATTFSKQVALSWFVKAEFNFKFVAGDNWGKEELNADGTAPGNRSGAKASYRGKTMFYTVPRFR